MWIINHKKIFYGLSIILLGSSLLAIAIWGLKPGVDFSGGSLLGVSFGDNAPKAEEISKVLTDLGFKDASVRSSEGGYMIRLKEISLEQKSSIIKNLSFDGLPAQAGKYAPVEKTFSSVGPILGAEAIHKSWISIVIVLLAIVLFIAFAFRKVSKPARPDGSVGRVSSWVYGLVTVLALLHDVLVPTGIFAILGHFFGFEVDTLFVTALLVILGFSVHDTIVVFDRVRENLHKNTEYKEGKTFDTVVGESISQTLIRSLNTSLTVLLAIIALYIWGPETVRNFSLVLIIGIAIGTYSSICIGSPLLVTINNWKNK